MANRIDSKLTLLMNQANQLLRQHGATITFKHCPLYLSDYCHDSSVTKIKLCCGCICCRDCMRLYFRRTIEQCGAINYTICSGSNHNPYQIPLRLAFAVCAFSDEQKANFDKIMASYVILVENPELKFEKGANDNTYFNPSESLTIFVNINSERIEPFGVCKADNIVKFKSMICDREGIPLHSIKCIGFRNTILDNDCTFGGVDCYNGCTIWIIAEQSEDDMLQRKIKNIVKTVKIIQQKSKDTQEEMERIKQDICQS